MRIEKAPYQSDYEGVGSLFPHLRELLMRAPSRFVFDEIWRYLVRWRDRDSVGLAMTYADEHLNGWPDMHRVADMSLIWPDCPLGGPSSRARLLRSLCLDGVCLGDEEWGRLLGSPYLSQLTQLDFGGMWMNDAMLHHFVKSPYFGKLEQLSLGPSNKEALASITRAPALANLKRLLLRGNPYDDSLSTDLLASAIATSSILSGLEHLEVGYNTIGPTGIIAIAESMELTQLRYLAAPWNHINDDGAFAIARSLTLSRLETLDLGSNSLGDRGVELLASSDTLKQLRHLTLRENGIDTRGLRALVGSSLLSNLRVLSLDFNAIGTIGALLLAQSPLIGGLRSLHLAGCQIGDEGVEALAASPYLRNLTSLSLGYNGITGRGLKALGEAHWGKLEKLILRDNDFRDEEALAMQAGGGFPALKTFEFQTDIPF